MSSQPSPLSILRFGVQDEKMQGINKLLTSDKDNETKTRINTIYGMTMLDYFGALSDPHEKIGLVDSEGKEQQVQKTVSALTRFFGQRYRINAISSEGKSREEYAFALSSYLAQQLMTGQMNQQMRMEEGAKKGQQ